MTMYMHKAVAMTMHYSSSEQAYLKQLQAQRDEQQAQRKCVEQQAAPLELTQDIDGIWKAVVETSKASRYGKR